MEDFRSEPPRRPTCQHLDFTLLTSTTTLGLADHTVQSQMAAWRLPGGEVATCYRSICGQESETSLSPEYEAPLQGMSSILGSRVPVPQHGTLLRLRQSQEQRLPIKPRCPWALEPCRMPDRMELSSLTGFPTDEAQRRL